jgi:DNA-binding transcriptional MerR regulator
MMTAAIKGHHRSFHAQKAEVIQFIRVFCAAGFKLKNPESVLASGKS